MYTTVSGGPPSVPGVGSADTAEAHPPGIRRWWQLCRALVAVWRPGQWPKNVLVVCVPLIDLDTWTLAALGRVGLAVVVFTVASTIVYIGNDLADRERDRNHPTKRLRVIAAGRLPARVAVAAAVVQVGVLAALLTTQPPLWTAPILAYLLLSLAYSLKLKHLPILDVFAVAAGFVLRLLMGYTATAEPVAAWLLSCVFTLCLLLTLGKRRHELNAFGAAYRPALRGYTVQLTDRLMMLSAVLTAVAYLLYIRTEAPLGAHAPAAALLSVPFALYGLFRYLQVVEIHQSGEDPVRTLLHDPAMIVNSVLWASQSAVFLVAAHTSTLGTLLPGSTG